MTNYIPGLTEESQSLYEAYKKQYTSNPFAEGTLDTGNKLIDTMKEEKKKRWEEVITSIDLTHHSRKAWQTIKKLSNDPTSPNPPCLVNSNQVAHHLLVNGHGTMPTKEPSTQSTQVVAHNVYHMLHREQDPQDMEAIKDYRHTENMEGLCDSEEL